jgi:hypothetical protein
MAQEYEPGQIVPKSGVNTITHPKGARQPAMGPLPSRLIAMRRG